MSSPSKYANAERERRFVLASLPSDATQPREVLDRYVDGTRMRLRSVTTPEGVVYKLGQKVRPTPDDPSLVLHTTLYLERDEFELLESLAAHTLRKTRHHVERGGAVMSVDVFHDELDGLILAEVDFGDDAIAAREFTPPPFCVVEVTADERFTGGRLARATRAEVSDAVEVLTGLRL
jgi:hypothetical protein